MDSVSNVPEPATSNYSVLPQGSPPSTSDTTSAATTTAGGETAISESGRSALSESVLKCLQALESAENDTERMAALFLVPKLVKGSECDKNSRLHLMQGIGFSFLARMLRSKDTPEGCPEFMYQSVALSVLSCFTGDEEIMTNPSVLFNLPVLLDIINNADSTTYEENLVIINDAYHVLTSIVSTSTGRTAFINNRGIHFLCEIIIKESFQHELALNLMLSLLQFSGQTCWLYHTGTDDFNNLMTKLCNDFELCQEEPKFELCNTLRILIKSFPKSNFEEEPWLFVLQKGLRDVLFSKIGKKQRDPAIKLVATVIETSDFEWCLTKTSKNESRFNDGSKFLLIIINLACIEVIMHLEEQKLEEVVEDGDLLVSCYSIIESAVAYLANERLEMLEPQQRSQIMNALNNAYSTILKFLAEISSSHRPSLEDLNVRQFVCATIRILAAWLAEETMANREEVYKILQFVLILAVETFEAQKLEKLHSLPGRGSTDYRSFSGENVIKHQDNQNCPDVLRFLLPGLCHLVTEDDPRKTVLDLKLPETLYVYLSYHWSIFDSFRVWLEDQAKAEIRDDVTEPKYMIDNARFEMVSSKYALISICNVLMNLIVLEPKYVSEASVFFHMLTFIMNSMTSLENRGETLVLHGNFCVLGLLILRHHSTRPKPSDFACSRFIQAVIRFLWDALNCDDCQTEYALGVSLVYADYWNETEELWFLGMQVLSNLIQMDALSWIPDFIIDSGWAFEVVKMLEHIRKGGIEQGHKQAFDDLLSSLARVKSDSFSEELRRHHDIIQLCQRHHLKELASVMSKTKKKTTN